MNRKKKYRTYPISSRMRLVLRLSLRMICSYVVVIVCLKVFLILLHPLVPGAFDHQRPHPLQRGLVMPLLSFLTEIGARTASQDADPMHHTVG